MPTPAAPKEAGADQPPSGSRRIKKPAESVADTTKPAFDCVMKTSPRAARMSATCALRTLGSDVRSSVRMRTAWASWPAMFDVLRVTPPTSPPPLLLARARALPSLPPPLPPPPLLPLCTDSSLRSLGDARQGRARPSRIFCRFSLVSLDVGDIDLPSPPPVLFSFLSDRISPGVSSGGASRHGRARSFLWLDRRRFSLCTPPLEDCRRSLGMPRDGKTAITLSAVQHASPNATVSPSKKQIIKKKNLTCN